MATTKLSVEETMELARVVSTLETVLENLRDGTVTVSHGGESVTLRPASVVHFELKASQKKDKGKLNIELSWKQPKESGTSGLSIG